MKTKVFCIIVISILASCSRKKNTEVVFLPTEAGNGSRDITVEKVELVKKIEPMLSEAVKQHWTRETWIAKFGPPLRERAITEGGLLLEYIEPGPYMTSAQKLITGVTIILQNGKTIDHDWHYTSFGM